MSYKLARYKIGGLHPYSVNILQALLYCLLSLTIILFKGTYIFFLIIYRIFFLPPFFGKTFSRVYFFLLITFYNRVSLLIYIQRSFPSAQNILFYKGFVLVCPGCCNKIPQTEWLINNINLFLTVLEAGKSKIKMLADSVSGEERRLSGCMLSCSQTAVALL